MKGLFNLLTDRFFTKMQIGTLNVTYEDGTVKSYGNSQPPKATIVLHNDKLLRRITLYGDIGFAESYMDNDFDCDDLTSLISLALLNSKNLYTKSEDDNTFSITNMFPYINRIKHFLRQNSKTESKKNISEHYDLSNDFFKLFLDDTMMYSAAVFKESDESLFEAQNRKIELLAKKLNLKPQCKVLEIGSGWGAMALHLTTQYQAQVTTLTLSKEQKKLCEARFKKNNVEAYIDILLKDYRDIEGKYDAIIAVEMFEAVGKEYFEVFFKKCESLLKPNGILVMQIITMPDNRYEDYCRGTDFIQKYIFPGGHLPSVGKILETTSRHTRLNLLHMEEFTEHYAKTLRIWYENFNKKLSEVKSLGFDEYFIRMWNMYLCYCEAAFLTRNINLVQICFTRDQNMALNKGLVA